MTRATSRETLAVGRGILLAIAIMYFCLAGASVLSTFIPLIFMMGGSFLTATFIVGLITLPCTIAAAVLLIIAGKRLERKLLFIAGFILLGSFVLALVLGVIYSTLGTTLEHALIDSGMDVILAIHIAYGLVVSLPSVVPSVLFAVCLVKDALKNEITIVIPIISLVLVASGIAYYFIQIGLIWLGFSTFSIPFGIGATALNGVYFLLVRNSLRAVPTTGSTLERVQYS
ncbi:MAG: hypothetical protein Q6373_007410 [Candidatus Sigynarchaeota archaeon]